MADETILLPFLPLSRFLYVSFKLNPELDSLRCVSKFYKQLTLFRKSNVSLAVYNNIERCLNCIIVICNNYTVWFKEI